MSKKNNFDGTGLLALGLSAQECPGLDKVKFERLHRPVGPICLYDMKDKLNKALEISESNIRVTEKAYRSVYRKEMLEKPLENFVAPIHFRPRNKAALRRAFNRVMKKFVRRERAVGPSSLEEAYTILMEDKGDHFAGLPTLGRKDEDVDALDRARQCWAGKCPPPPVIGHRGKNEEIVRAVWMLAFEWHIVEAAFYYPLYREFSTSQEIYPVGLINTRRYRFRKYSRLEGMNTKLSLDYSGFDASVSPEMIGMAFQILESMLDLTDEQKKVWKRICTFFATSPFLAPDGKVYKGRKGGVPSGSMFTQVIDSLANAIAIEYALDMTGIEKYRYVVYGDDSWIICKHENTPEELISMIKEHVESLGLKMHGPEKTEYAAPATPIVFCGHYDIQRGRPLQQAIDKLCYPERPSKELTTREGQCERILSYIADAECPALNALYLSIAKDVPIEITMRSEGAFNLNELLLATPGGLHQRHLPGILQILDLPKTGSTLMRIRAAL